MAVALVQSAASTIASLTTTATLGSSPTPGNVLTFWINLQGAAAVTTPPSGSTLVGNGFAPSGSQIAVYRKVVAGGDSTAWSVTVSADVVAMVAIEASGVDTTTPISNTLTYASVTGTTVTGPTVTPVTADIGGIVLTGLAPDTSKTVTVPAGWTRIANASVGSSFHNMDTARLDAAVASTSAITGLVWTWTGSTAAVTTTLILRPAAVTQPIIVLPPRRA